MLRRGSCGRIAALFCLFGLVALAACDRDDGDTTIADDASDERERDEDPDTLVCADLNCGEAHVCVVPGLYCDRSGPEPVLTRDAPYCAPLTAATADDDDGPAVDDDDRTLESMVQRICPRPDVILSDDGRDGTMLRCPGLDVDGACE